MTYITVYNMSINSDYISYFGREAKLQVYQRLVGNYTEKCPVRIWKRYIPLLIDLLISNNFSSMTFFCATRILRVIVRQSSYTTVNQFFY